MFNDHMEHFDGKLRSDLSRTVWLSSDVDLRCRSDSLLPLSSHALGILFELLDKATFLSERKTSYISIGLKSLF